MSEIKKERKTMAARILVPLKRHERIEQIVPCIEKVAEPGASVVFLVHHPVNGFKCCKPTVGSRNAVWRKRSRSDE